MPKRDLRYFLLGVLITAATACQPFAEDSGQITVEPEVVVAPTVTATVGVVIEPTISAPTMPPPASPTAQTGLQPPELAAEPWSTIGGERSGLALPVPPGWVNLTDQITVPALGNRLGINLLFVADSERTGRSLLAGKSFDDGAYVAGLLAESFPGGSPVDQLAGWLLASEPALEVVGQPVSVVSANGLPGAYVDLVGGPVGLSIPELTGLRTRVAAFEMPAVDGRPSPWLMLLLSATSDRWDDLIDEFDAILQATETTPIRPGTTVSDRGLAVRGELEGDRDLVSAVLEPGISDVWTFTTSGNRYTSLFLRSDETQLDLTLTLFGPDRQTIARVDNGYAGAGEAITDLRLGQPGVYVVEVSDFFGATGRYTLSLDQADVPQYSGGGDIEFGQAIQGELQPQGQQYWIFEGNAGQQVSIVAEPQASTFDVILELYGPDGQQLVALDEGFSGDPEVINGFDLMANGEFAILIRSFSPQGGPYTLSLDESAPDIANFYDAGDLAYGDTRQETLQQQEAHTWFFQGRAGDLIQVRLAPLSSNLDLELWLLDSDIRRVATADQTAAGEQEALDFILTRDGQYILFIRDFNSEAGQYEIALSAAPIATPESAGTVTFGDRVMGAIPTGSSVAWLLSAQAGDVFDLVVEPAEASSDIVLILESPDGIAILEVDENSAGQNEQLDDFVLPSGGTWRIILREFFGEPAPYQLALDRVE